MQIQKHVKGNLTKTMLNFRFNVDKQGKYVSQFFGNVKVILICGYTPYWAAVNFIASI